MGNQNAGPPEVIGQIALPARGGYHKLGKRHQRRCRRQGQGALHPLTAESLAAANPDCIIVLTAGLQTVGGQDILLQLPGVGQTAAAEQGGILPFEYQYFVGGGLRMGNVLRELLAAFHLELAP